jgi:hypothetical protein
MINNIVILYDERITHNKDHILWNGWWSFAARHLLGRARRNG